MKFTVDEDVFSLFPGLTVGVLRGRGLDNRTSSPALLSKLQAAQLEIRSFLDLGTLAEHKSIVVWRRAYRLFGAKPA